MRRGTITPQECLEAWQRYGVLRSHLLQVEALVAEYFEAVARLCLAQAPLRPGGALRLALCQRLNLQLVSFDRGLCKAAIHHQVVHKQLTI